MIVRDPLPVQAINVALYARVSSIGRKNDLERQLERLKEPAAAHGSHVTRKVQEIGSGQGERHPRFLQLLTDPTIGVLVVEHRAVARALVSRPSQKRCTHALRRLVAASLRFAPPEEPLPLGGLS